LGDGNRASVGDLIITRANDRRLRITATDWVKNGDRWTVLNLTGTGGVTVRHVRNGRTVTLPAGYVSTATELGYASTVHTAQGVTADTVHGVVTGEESRQQLYTMLTRGRTANHIYVSVVSDGNPHTLIRPEAILPSTANRAARTNPCPRRQPYIGQHPAARTTCPRRPARHRRRALPRRPAHGRRRRHRQESVQAVETSANQLLPGLSDEPAWPTLRSHLLLLAAAGADPAAELHIAATTRDLTSAYDQAAVIDSRIQDINQVTAGGPLPWLPGIPHRLAVDPDWGPYLNARSQLVAELADQVRLNAEAEAPAWAAQTPARVPAELIADVQVWRAATQVDPNDLRPTGPTQLGAARIFQQQLDKRLTAADTNPDGQWRRLLATEAPAPPRTHSCQNSRKG
jgi:hypothetical protein